MEFPKVIGETEGIFLIQIDEENARIKDIGDDESPPSLMSPGPVLSLLSRLPYETFTNDESYVLDLYENDPPQRSLKKGYMEKLNPELLEAHHVFVSQGIAGPAMEWRVSGGEHRRGF